MKLLQCVCGKAWYCDKNCQKLDWKAHKKACPPFAIKDVGPMGKGLVATRNLPKAACVFEENSLFSSKTAKIDEKKLLHVFSKLTPEKQAEVLNLNDPKGPDNDDDNNNNGEKLKRIFDENHMVISDFFSPTTYQLFVKSSMINHSCNPNSFLANTTETAQLVTFVEVKKGVELTHNYYYHGMMVKEISWLKYYDRQQMIMQDYNFVCKCVSCLKGCKVDLLREQHRFLDTTIEDNKKKFKPSFALAEKKLQLGKLFDNGLLFEDFLDCFIAGRKEKYQNAEVFEKDIKFKREFKIFMKTGAFGSKYKQQLIEELGLNEPGI